MSKLSNRGLADNLRTLPHLVRTAKRSSDPVQRSRVVRDARAIVKRAKTFYAEEPERTLKEHGAVLKRLVEAVHAALEIIEADLNALEGEGTA